MTCSSGTACRCDAASPSRSVADGGDPLRAAVDLPVHPRACALARRTARQLLEGWAVGEELAHDALVVVSELVGNAVRHGDVRVVLEVAVEPRGLLVAVTDGGEGTPRQRTDADGESGRGLRIVAAMALAWGTEPLGSDGKRVWALLPLHHSGPEATHP